MLKYNRNAIMNSLSPQVLIEKYGVIENNADEVSIPDDLKQYKVDFFPGGNTRKAGCHQKAWKLYQKEPKNRPESPLSLVLLNVDKWINDEQRVHYCISVGPCLWCECQGNNNFFLSRFGKK
jgi:hypothetical protein